MHFKINTTVFPMSTSKKWAGIFLILFTLPYTYLNANEHPSSAKKKGPVEKAKAKKSLGFEQFDFHYFEQKNITSVPIEVERNRARNVINEVDELKRYVDYLAPSDLNKLPIGFKKKIGETTVKIAVSNAVFTSRYAELTVYAKIDIPQRTTYNNSTGASESKSIFFGVSGLKLSKDGGIIGEGKLVLLGDYTIPINGDNASITLKGGFDKVSGGFSGRTYLSMDCNGFKEMGLEAEVAFPRSLLVPVSPSGQELAGQVKASFATVVSNWNDILAEVNLPLFEIKGIPGIGFKINNAVVDLSDLRNSSNISYPPGYYAKYLGNLEADMLNLWRGVYAREISVYLPSAFERNDDNNRTVFSARDLVIDNNGVTGNFLGQNLIPLSSGVAGTWRFSVDSFRVQLEANRLLAAGFGGRIVLPVNNRDLNNSDSAETNKKSFAYSGLIMSNGEYLCRVVQKDNLDFDLWKAKVELYPNSFVELRGGASGFRPLANLTGKMDIKNNEGSDGGLRPTSLMDFKGIQFQQLVIKTTPPYLSAQYFGYDGSIKLGPLPVSVDNISLRTIGNNDVLLDFGVTVNLGDPGKNSFSGRSGIEVKGRYEMDGKRAVLRYDGFRVKEIELAANITALSLYGRLNFMENDPVYGDGFAGRIILDVKQGQTSKFGLDVTAKFGNAGFRYWYVDGLAKIPMEAGAINITSFGGGAYYRMRKSPTPSVLNDNPTGVSYIPDSTAGLGLKASVGFNVGSEKIDDALAMLEISFYRGGGIRFMGFYGWAKVIPGNKSPFNSENITGMIKSHFKELETFDSSLSQAQKENQLLEKFTNPSRIAETITDASFVSNEKGVGMDAYIGLMYNFETDEFHANFDLRINLAPVLKGVGPNGRAGWAMIHIYQDNSYPEGGEGNGKRRWYFHVGTPNDPIGMKLGFGPISVVNKSYFMMGHDLPPFPGLPPSIYNRLHPEDRFEPNIQFAEKEEIKSGRGIAFGTSMDFDSGELSFAMLYARFRVGFGLNVMIRDYSGYQCVQTGNEVGLNGWLAQGAVGAYLEGNAGLRIKLGPIKKNIEVIKSSAVAALQFSIPRPTAAQGLLRIQNELLGGKVKINLRLKMKFGDDCTLVANETDGEIDFDAFKVISHVTPNNNMVGVSLFSRPVVHCQTKPNVAFSLPSDKEGDPEETFRPFIESVSFIQGSQSIPATFKMANDNSSFTVFPSNPFVAETQYKLKVVINYQRLVSNTWVNVTYDDGSVANEIKEVNFTTGKNPPFIERENIGFMYPYIDQRFFYKNEVQTGKIFLKTWQTQLLSSFSAWKVRFTDRGPDSTIFIQDVSLDAANKSINYNIPAGLQASKTYKFELFGVGFSGGNGVVEDSSKPILDFVFSTSQFGTLEEKINFLTASNPTPIIGRIESDVIDLQAEVTNYEGFDMAELIGVPFTGNVPVIQSRARITDNDYYTTRIQPLIKYPNFVRSGNKVFNVSRDTSVYGVIPTKAIHISDYYVSALTGSTYSPIINKRVPFIYDVNRVYNEDFIAIRTAIVNHYYSNLVNNPCGNTPIYTTIRTGFLGLKRETVMTECWKAYYASPAYRNSLISLDLFQIPDSVRKFITQAFPFMYKGDYQMDLSISSTVGLNGFGEPVLGTPTNVSTFAFHNPINGKFYNELQTQIFYPENCRSGEIASPYTFTVLPGEFSSVNSVEEANQKALDFIAMNGQLQANLNGTCCLDGDCYTNGMATIQISAYLSNCSYYNTPTGTMVLERDYDHYYFPFDNYGYGYYNNFEIPAGVYRVYFIYESGYNNYVEFSIGDNYFPVYSWGSGQTNSQNIKFDKDTYHYGYMNASCNGY